MTRFSFVTTASILLIFLYGFRLWQTTGCRHFSGFYFNPDSIKINVETNSGLDINQDKTTARIFHNKLSAGTFELTKSYLATFDSRLILAILGPLGVVLVLRSAVALTSSNLPVALHLLTIPLTSALALTAIGPRLSFYLAASVWYSFSFWGLAYFAKTSLRFGLFLILMIATIWYFFFNWQMPAICNEIAFN